VKTVERIIMKAAVIQFDVIPQLKQITKYEGVTKNTVTKIVETFSKK
jgi:hypothetical protein